MKKTVKFYTIISILFSLFIFHSFSMFFSNYQYLTKVYADDDGGDDDNDDGDDDDDDNDDGDDDDDDNDDGDDDDDDDNDDDNDDDEDLKKSSNSIKVAPVESKLQPVLYTPQIIQPQVLESLPKIEVSIPTIPSNDQIKQMIDNVKDLNGVVSSINLEETANGILKGEVITKQKILGLIEIQIPYKVTLDSISGTIKERFPKDIWNSFLDFISF